MDSLSLGSKSEMERLQDLLEDLEAVAEEVLCDRQEIISLDRRRNTNREALRALRNSIKAQSGAAGGSSLSTAGNKSSTSTGKIREVPERNKPAIGSVPLVHDSPYCSKTWMCIGDMFIRMPKIIVMDAIETEQHRLDKGIKDLRDGLVGKVNALRKLEGDEPSRGTLLSPLSREEWKGVQQVLGGRC